MVTGLGGGTRGCVFAAGVGRVGGEHRCGTVWGLGGGMWGSK